MTYEYFCIICKQNFTRPRLRGSTTECTPCQKKRRAKAWKKANPERLREHVRKHNATPEAKARKAKWQSENPEKMAAKSRRWRKNNPERSKEILANYRERHHETLKTRYQVRRHHKRMLWGDPRDIGAFYDCARRVSECTGIEHEVDHVIPLQGKVVSGLHVPENLRVVTRNLNRSKSNRLEAA